MTGLLARSIVFLVTTSMLLAAFQMTARSARADPGGSDAGSDIASARAIVAGDFTGSLSSSDTNDYYSFQATSGQDILIEMGYATGSSSCDFDIKLYNPSGTEKARSYKGAGQTENIDFTADSTGKWALRIYRYSGDGTYAFTVLLGSSTTTTSDTTPPAIAILGPTGTVFGHVEISATVSDDSGIESVQYVVGTGTYKTMTRSGTSSTYTATWDTSSIADGSKTLKVKAADTQGNSREASVTVTIANANSGGSASLSDANLGTDAGNTLSVPSFIGTGMNKQGHLDSTDKYDHYSFDVLNGQTISVTMVPPTGADFDIKLYNPAKSCKARSTNPAGQAESLTFTATSAGRWILKVYRNSGEGYYTFGVSVDTVTRDNTKPALSIVSPTSNEEVSGEITIKASVSDDVGVAAVKYRIGTTGEYNIMSFMRTGYYEAKLNTNALGDGTKTVYVAAYDTSGNSDTKNVRFTVTNTHVAKWTVMVYDAVDNDLTSARSSLKQYGSTSDVNYIELEDLEGNNNTRIWMIQRYGESLVMDMGEANTGDPNTLKTLIDFSKAHYPAQNYALIISGHGGGMGGVAFDNFNGHDKLTLAEIKNILKNDGIPIKLFGLDSCVQGNMEIAYEYRSYVDYIVASQDFDTGFDYSRLAQSLNDHPDWSAADLAKDIVDDYQASRGSSTSTMAAYDCSKLTTLKTKLATLATKLKAAASNSTRKAEIILARNATQACHEWNSYVDVYDMALRIKVYVNDAAIRTAAQAVMDAMNTTIIKNKVSSWGQMKNAHGLGIYYQVEGTQCGNWFSPKGSYQTLDCEFLSGTDWNEFILAINS